MTVSSTYKCISRIFHTPTDDLSWTKNETGNVRILSNAYLQSVYSSFEAQWWIHRTEEWSPLNFLFSLSLSFFLFFSFLSLSLFILFYIFLTIPSCSIILDVGPRAGNAQLHTWLTSSAPGVCVCVCMCVWACVCVLTHQHILGAQGYRQPK